MCMYCDGIDRAMTEVIAARHTPETEWFWTELRVIGERWNVLHHPFYVRWSRGELTAHELARYAAEYLHLAVGLASVSRHAVAKADGLLAQLLKAHAVEESEHVDLWFAFADASNPDTRWFDEAVPFPETLDCARVWAGDEGRSLGLDLVTLYAIERPQPDIAQTKLDGLLGFYGFAEGPATEYFRVHTTRDVEHAALAASALEGMFRTEDPFSLLGQADAVHRVYWHVLDRLEQERPPCP